MTVLTGSGKRLDVRGRPRNLETRCLWLGAYWPRTVLTERPSPPWKRRGRLRPGSRLAALKDPRFPTGHGQTGEHPVVCVSFLDAEAFCAWLTKRDAAKLPSGWH